mmetsp:Transcript_25758/g.71946  ORF Transcript_25758/g.71946 Transcript_25758/m.71946 type:complete len:312 (-) Transcript_25758:1814-2749(-)
MWSTIGKEVRRQRTKQFGSDLHTCIPLSEIHVVAIALSESSFAVFTISAVAIPVRRSTASCEEILQPLSFVQVNVRVDGLDAGHVIARCSSLGARHFSSIEHRRPLPNDGLAVHDFVILLTVRILQLLKECVDHDGLHQIVDQDDAEDVEAQEVPSHPLVFRRQFESFLAHHPIVHHQQIEEDVHGAHHIVEIVAPILGTRKVGIQQQFCHGIVGIACDHATVQQHPQHGKEVQQEEEEQQHAASCGQNLGRDPPNQLELWHRKQQAHQSEHTCHDDQSDQAAVVVSVRVVHEGRCGYCGYGHQEIEYVTR